MPAPDALAEAAGRLGRGVAIEPVSSNEELERLLGTEPPVDLIFPSDYLVERLVAAGALAELELPVAVRDRLAGWAHELACDPGCRRSIPFAFGTTGFLFDREVANGDASSWSLLLQPAGDRPVGMLDEVREVVGAALIAAGHDPNQVGEPALTDARALLEAQRPRVARYDGGDFVGPVVAGELAVHHAWSGPAAWAARKYERLEYVVPREGAVLWVTTGAVPAAAPEPELAAAVLRELTDPGLAVRTTLEHGFATPNEVARGLLPAPLRDDPALFADERTLARCHILHDLGPDEARLAAVFPG